MILIFKLPNPKSPEMIFTNFEQFFYSKGISKPFAWLVKNGLSRTTANRLLNNKMKSIPFKVLEKICIQGWCTPNDIFQWQPDDKTKDIPNHPLQDLRTKVMPNVQNKLKTLNADQLFQVDELIEKLRNPKDNQE